MANITVSIPDAIAPEVADEMGLLLVERGIDSSPMTQGQKIRKYLAEVSKDVLGHRRRRLAEESAAGTVTAAITQAGADASGIT